MSITFIPFQYVASVNIMFISKISINFKTYLQKKHEMARMIIRICILVSVTTSTLALDSLRSN